MSIHREHTPSPEQVAEMQAALFSLRDGLMRLKMSLQELACLTDEEGQRMAAMETQSLLSRLRA